jgi:RNA polymerase sigma factor (sigma-70 family)
MSVEFGGGSAEVWSAGQAPQDADRQVITNLYDTYAAHLFDYCVTVLQDPAAAADAVQDTLIAADAQIGKLRDPERLRVWLYCIARRQCLSDLPRGSETITPDEIFAGYRVTIDADTSDFEFPDVDSEALARETLLVVTAALRGLSGDDQEVVSLAYRHGLGGADLATVLGISGRRAAALLSGASMRFEESADTVTVLRAGAGTCPVLGTIAGKWDPAAPRLTPELRRRLTRHISSCDDCSRSRGDIFGPELLGAVPLAVLPAEFREQVTRTVFATEPGSYRRSVVRRAGKLGDDGFPVQAPGRSNLPKVMAASAALVVLIVGGVMFHELTSASAVGSKTTAAAAATTSPTSAPAGTSSSVPPVRKTHKRHSPTAFPGQLGPAPGPTSVMPVPPVSPAPSPTHSRKPSPSPSHSKTPTPSPTRTTPTPTPTTPTPTPTTPTPTPTTTTPTPSP